MRHPFDGVSTPSNDGLTRRSVLGALAAATAGLAGLNAATAQVASTQAVGEEGGVKISTAAVGEEGAATTRALNEEGAANRPLTSEPFGEEAGKVVSHRAPGLEDGGPMNPNPVTDAVNEQGGVTTKAVGEEGGPIATTLALGEEGGLTKALNENGGRVVAVPVKPNTTELKEAQLKAVWADMASADSAKGVQACAVLYGSKNAVPFLKENLKVEKVKLVQADEKMLAALIAALDSDTFEEREKAEAKLTELGQAAAVAIERAIKEAKSPEQRMRLERLREKCKEQSAQTQAKRGLEVLVALKTPEAKELLEKLAKGEQKEWLTQVAKEALERASK